MVTFQHLEPFQYAVLGTLNDKKIIIFEITPQRQLLNEIYIIKTGKKIIEFIQ